MPEPFKSIEGDPRPTDAMSRAQIGLIMGLESVLHQAGLVLVCTRCAVDGFPLLHTDNAPSDEIWKIDCHCRRRRIARMDSQMSPSGWLLLMVKELLEPLGLDVRCPSKACLLHPLTIRQSADGTKVTVTCQCGGEYKFSKTKTTKPH